jgi:hypothetical protein
MDLNDYELPAEERYAPRLKASQRVAAQKRARHDDTEPITPVAHSRSALPFGVGAVLIIIAMIGMASYGPSRLPGVPLAVTPGPSTAAFLSAPTPAPAQSPAPTAAIRTIGAYASPDGLLLGQIEATRKITPVAHYGANWVQADVAGSGLVWLRAQDVPDLAIVGPDLSPAAAEQPQTGRGLTVDPGGGWTLPEATPELEAPPAEPTVPAAWPTSAPASPKDFEKPDIQDRCKFVTCLGQQAVDLARAQACNALYWQYGDTDPETILEPDLSAVRGCIWEGLYR